VIRAIIGATVITPGATLPNGTVVYDDRVVTNVLSSADRPAHADATLDAAGLILAPGFIELQVNGGFGLDLTSDPGSIWQLGARLVEFGVTAFLPTIISSPPGVINTAQEVIRVGPPAGYRGAVPLGLHLEGPFLAPSKRGAHRLDCLRPPNTLETQNWSPADGVAMVTLAPELPGALDLIRQLAGRGVVVSAGHSAADFTVGQEAIDAGIRYGTHLFNGMTGLDHRSPGLAAALLNDERVTVGLIVDGVHVHPQMIRLAWRLAGPNRVSLVSDAMAGLGSSPGRFQLGGQDVIVAESRGNFPPPLGEPLSSGSRDFPRGQGRVGARLDDGTLAGSILPLDQAVRNLVAFTDCPPEVALRVVTAVPAGLLRLIGRGVIGPGSRADFVLVGERLELVATILGGEIAYAANGAPSWT
jgi:N-acetylglucosamine-6-phosphate deacetylase